MAEKQCIWSLLHKKDCVSSLKGKNSKSLLHGHVTKGVCWEVVGSSGNLS